MGIKSYFARDAQYPEKTSDLLLETQLRVESTGPYLDDFQDQTSFITTLFATLCVRELYIIVCVAISTCVCRYMFRCLLETSIKYLSPLLLNLFWGDRDSHWAWSLPTD